MKRLLIIDDNGLEFCEEITLKKDTIIKGIRDVEAIEKWLKSIETTGEVDETGHYTHSIEKIGGQYIDRLKIPGKVNKAIETIQKDLFPEKPKQPEYSAISVMKYDQPVLGNIYWIEDAAGSGFGDKELKSIFEMLDFYFDKKM
jgi:hypothetical protein